MGSGCNQRRFDLRFQLLSKLNWQFDVCSPASSDGWQLGRTRLQSLPTVNKPTLISLR
jgi:hypothetical protein